MNSRDGRMAWARAASCIAMIAVIITVRSASAPADPGPPADQNKYVADSGSCRLFFTDGNSDSWHDPCELWNITGTIWNRNNSCWMASAANMLSYEGVGSLYGLTATINYAVAFTPWDGPTTTEWGTIVLCVLMLGTAVWVLRRRSLIPQSVA